MRVSALLFSLLLVTGCDGQPGSNTAAPANGDAASAESDLPMPGKYESATSAQFTVPGQGMQQLDRTDELCVGGSGLEDVKAALRADFMPICVSGEIVLKGGDISGQMTCRIAELRGAESVVNFSGSYDRKSIDLALDTSMGEASVRQTRPYRYTGPC